MTNIYFSLTRYQEIEKENLIRGNRRGGLIIKLPGYPEPQVRVLHRIASYGIISFGIHELVREVIGDK